MPHKLDTVRFATWAYVDLFLLFGAIFFVRQSAGLAGLGAIMILGSLQILANHKAIWHDYVATYRKSSSAVLNKLQEPKPLYYRFNIYFLWPMVMILGIMAIFAALTI